MMSGSDIETFCRIVTEILFELCKDSVHDAYLTGYELLCPKKSLVSDLPDLRLMLMFYPKA